MHKEILPEILIIFNIQNMPHPVTEVLLFSLRIWGQNWQTCDKRWGKGGQAPGEQAEPMRSLGSTPPGAAMAGPRPFTGAPKRNTLSFHPRCLCGRWVLGLSNHMHCTDPSYCRATNVHVDTFRDTAAVGETGSLRAALCVPQIKSTVGSSGSNCTEASDCLHPCIAPAQE